MRGLVISCHDCSEGGLGVALAEMCFGGGVGVAVELSKVKFDGAPARDDHVLFAESNSRFVVEVARGLEPDFVALMRDLTVGAIGSTTKEKKLRIIGRTGQRVADAGLHRLSRAWRANQM